MPTIRCSCLCLALALASAIGCGGDSDGDGMRDGGGDPDAAVDTTPVAATPGARCEAHARIGLVEIADGYLSAQLFDRPSPLLSPPRLTDAACAFYEYAPSAPCDVCQDGAVCSQSGACVPAQRLAADGRVALRAGTSDQVFVQQPGDGAINGEITLASDAFAIEVFAFGQLITLGETARPAPLVGLDVALTGTSEQPERIEVSWTSAEDGTSVFTHIPINHHAAVATFTECAVPSAAGSFAVERAMLEPLAVITGLEFQSVDHIRTAAAETSRGCVEIRLVERQF